MPASLRTPLARQLGRSVALSSTAAAAVLAVALITSGGGPAAAGVPVDAGGHAHGGGYGTEQEGGAAPDKEAPVLQDSPLDPEQATALVVQQNAQVTGEFRSDCATSHRGPDDPIVYPGQPSATQLHDFFGNRTTNATSSEDSLLAGDSNCAPAADHSAYWVSTLYQDGAPVAPELVTALYQGVTSPADAVAMPAGLKYLIGNSRAAGPEQNPVSRWTCAGLPEAHRSFPVCPPGTKLTLRLDFPTCWDGERTDSPDHRDHLKYPTGATCPDSHPKALPRLSLVVMYPVNGPGVTLAGLRDGLRQIDGAAFTVRGGFLNAWEPGEMERRVTDCVNVGKVCGPEGR